MTEKLLDELDLLSARFLEEFGPLEEAALTWKPEATSWSIAENLQHLILLNRSYLDQVKKLRKSNAKLPFLARFDFLVNFFGKAILKSVEPEATKKSRTFPIWQPKAEFPVKNIVERFLEVQEELKTAIKESEDLLAQEAKISSPANRNIVLRLEKAFEILIAHEERHFQQARRMLEKQKANL